MFIDFKITVNFFRYENRWDKLATEQAPIFLGDHSEEMADEVTRLFKAFDSEAAQSLFQDKSNKQMGDADKKKKDPDRFHRQPRLQGMGLGQDPHQYI